MKTMGRIIVALSAVLALSISLAGVAFADEGPHGGFGATGLAATTDKCAGCHRAHTALNANLLVATSVTALCESCHGSAGTGADTDVWDGKWVQGRSDLYEANLSSGNSNGQALNGGGFLAAWNASENTFATVTSRHGVAGLEAAGSLSAEPAQNDVTAWGGGAGGPGVAGDLECPSCHDPHGSGNYRILNAASGHGAITQWVTGAGTFQAGNVPSMEVSPSGTVVNGVTTPAHDYTAGVHVAYDRGISDFCGACHTEYLNNMGNNPNGEVYDAGDGKGAVARFRHPVSSKNPSTLATNSWIAVDAGLRRVGADLPATPTTQFNDGQNVTCLTCHNAHGSSTLATGQAANVAPTDNSANLVLDNRGVCQSCHGKTN